MGKIISLKYDFSFKYLFQNELVRRQFISDVLGIPLTQIRSARLTNTQLWKKQREQKQGVLDVALELNDESQIDIELQIRMFRYWDSRTLFYLAKMFTAYSEEGEGYDRLKKCINISILGFKWDDSEAYHRVYRMRDENGRDFSDKLEIHIIELNKPLSGESPVDDWIRLIQAETEEDLDMLKLSTKREGILEAIDILKNMNLRQWAREAHEAELKARRDQWALEATAREEGIEEGMEQGLARGLKRGLKQGLEQAREESAHQIDRLNRLNLKLLEARQFEDLERAARDEAYRKKLYRIYDIQ